MARQSNRNKKQNRNKRNKGRSTPAAAPPTASAGGSSNPIYFGIGILCLVIAAAASGILVLGHFTDNVPGCGMDGGCAQAARSAWGRVPGINWPVSFLGFTYFLSMLAAWGVAGMRRAPILLWIARLGGLVSLMYLGVIALGGYTCWYCITAHLANFGFWFMLEMWARHRSDAPPVTAQRSFGSFIAGFVILSALLAIGLFSSERRIERKSEQQLGESITQITQQADEPADAAAPFTGRYTLGPENAAIRVVIFSDFQCPDCYNIEQQVRQLMSQRTDMSVSHKHFPMCTDCNTHMDNNLHPNACAAAMAAETAGLLYGNEGFWKMHHWLFDRKGSFTNAELEQGLRELGFDVQPFLQMMRNEAATVPLIQADTDEARRLGLFYTPMIFVNGVELKGFRAPNALMRTVEAVAAQNPQPAAPSADSPPTAFEKYVADWRDEPRLTMPMSLTSHQLGPADAKVQVVMWGDYRTPLTTEADARIRRAIDEGLSVSYTFRHFPIDQTCNQFAPRTMNPGACTTSKLAEAVAVLGGEDAFWKMHDWLLQNTDSYTEPNAIAFASSLGIDAQALQQEMNGATVINAIRQDAAGAEQLNLQGIPFICVNNQRIPRWKLEGHDVLGTIMAEAAP